MASKSNKTKGWKKADICRFLAQIIYATNVTFTFILVYRQTNPRVRYNCTLATQPRNYEPSIYIGIMSTRDNLNTRLDAALGTWLQSDNRHIKIEVFANGMDSTRKNSSSFQIVNRNGIQVIQLPGVRDDEYPPQRKSFLMLKYMERIHLNKFDWFIRVDDDSYINLKRLRRFLYGVNSSQPFYIGRAGYGKHEEDFLNFKENYCMGGSGMIFSKELLRQIGPKLETCFQKRLSEHEDIEIGRCVRKITNIQCTESYETLTLFHQHYGKDGQTLKNISDIRGSTLERVITFHAIKDQIFVYKFHKEILLKKMYALLKKANMYENINKEMFLEKLNDTEPDVIWNSKSGMYGKELIATSSYPIRPIDQTKKRLYLTDQYHLKKYVSLKNVRKVHLDTYFYEKPVDVLSLERIYLLKYRITKFTLKKKWKIVQNLTFFEESHLNVPLDLNSLHDFNGSNKTVYFLVTLNKREDIFLRFIKKFEEGFLKSKKNVKLIISAFSYSNNNSTFQQNITSKVPIILKSLEILYDKSFSRLITFNSSQPFSRGLGLQQAADSILDPDAILFFCDVDLVFNDKLLDRIMGNTIKDSTVYYPVFFSKYNPTVVDQYQDRYDLYDNDINKLNGFWRYFSYGMLSIYKSDFSKITGFDLSLEGWGKEDLLLADKLTKTGLKIFRSNDDSLIHPYHYKSCTKSFTTEKKDCVASKYSHYGSQYQLSKNWMAKKHQHNIPNISRHNKLF